MRALLRQNHDIERVQVQPDRAVRDNTRRLAGVADLRPGVAQQVEGELAERGGHWQGEGFRLLRRAGGLRVEKWKQQSHRGSRVAARVPDSGKVSRNLHDAGPGAGVLDRSDASQDVHEAYIRHDVRNDDRAHKAQIILDDRGERQAFQVARERDRGLLVEVAQLFVLQHQPERACIEGLLRQG